MHTENPPPPAERSAVRFFWAELLLVAAMSIAGNVVHAWMNAPDGAEPVAAFVATFPPIALLAATHGVGLLVRAQDRARLAYWAVVALTAAIAVAAFRLSFDALRELAVQVGMEDSTAWLFPVIVDGAIGQATVALLVLARPAPAKEAADEPDAPDCDTMTFEHIPAAPVTPAAPFRPTPRPTSAPAPQPAPTPVAVIDRGAFVAPPANPVPEPVTAPAPQQPDQIRHSDEKRATVLDLVRCGAGSNRAIGERTGVSEGTVRRWRKEAGI